MSSERVFANDVAPLDPLDLDDAIANQAAIMAYWVERLYKAEIAAGDERVSLEVYEAEHYTAVRKTAAVQGIKMTESAIEREIKRSQGWLNRRRELLRHEAEVNRLKGRLKAIEQKKAMLELFAHNRRQELRSLGKAA